MKSLQHILGIPGHGLVCGSNPGGTTLFFLPQFPILPLETVTPDFQATITLCPKSNHFLTSLVLLLLTQATIALCPKSIHIISRPVTPDTLQATITLCPKSIQFLTSLVQLLLTQATITEVLS